MTKEEDNDEFDDDDDEFEIDEFNDIDDTWLIEFKKNEKIYDEFYKDKVEQIKLFYLYVSSSNILESIKKDSITLDADGTLKKEKIISLIIQNQFYNTIKYKLLSLLRFNINLNPEEINDFVHNNDEENNEISSRFITSEKYLNDIKYSDTITIFQDLNCLYFIFYEEKANHNNNNNNNHNNNNHNNTKKIISMNIKKNKKLKKKTRRILRIENT